MSQFLNKFKNVGTITSIASLIMLIAATNGFTIDDVRIMTTLKAVCSIGVILGVLNDPNTPGIDHPMKVKEEQ